MSECENLDFRDLLEREIILENRRAEQQEMLEEKKKRNKTYLKGRYGKRLYYDYDKKYKNDYNKRFALFEKRRLGNAGLFIVLGY